MENPIKNGWFGENPLFSETFIYLHEWLIFHGNCIGEYLQSSHASYMGCWLRRIPAEFFENLRMIWDDLSVKTLEIFSRFLDVKMWFFKESMKMFWKNEFERNLG